MQLHAEGHRREKRGSVEVISRDSVVGERLRYMSLAYSVEHVE